MLYLYVVIDFSISLIMGKISFKNKTQPTISNDKLSLNNYLVK